MINSEELCIFYKFLYNRVNKDLFIEIMKKKYSENNNYLDEKWEEFSKNSISFLVARNEKFFIDEVNILIKNGDYRG